jgi:hypothetical protein
MACFGISSVKFLGSVIRYLLINKKCTYSTMSLRNILSTLISVLEESLDALN